MLSEWEIAMTEADRMVDKELGYLLIFWLQATACLAIFVFLCWALIVPAWSLPLSVLAYTIHWLAMGSQALRSTQVAHNRTIQFQNAVAVMVHANLVRSEWDENGGELIDRALRLADQHMGNALRDDGSLRSGAIGLPSAVASFLLGLAALALAAGSGLYFSAEVSNTLDHASAWVRSLRQQ